MIFLLSLENSITTKSRVSSAAPLEPSCLARCLFGTKPSTPYCKATTPPFSFLLIIVALCTEPTVKMPSNTSQGFSSSCLCPRLRRRFSTSTSSTTTSISSPILVNSAGCLIFFDHERSEMWIKPSTPSSISTKIPKLVKFLTVAVCFVSLGYLVIISSHGSGMSCFMPSDIFRSSLSRVRITASTLSPTFRKS